MFHNESHPTEFKSGIFAHDLSVGMGGDKVISHTASVENLFSYQPVVSNHNTWEE
jgi:hypothetical protein